MFDDSLINCSNVYAGGSMEVEAGTRDRIRHLGGDEAA
jgi:hypothetical protein